MESIPVVDFGPISGQAPSEADWTSVARRVDRVLSQIGVVYLRNHGVPEETIERAFIGSKEFFELEPEQKFKYFVDFKSGYSGYIAPNQERSGPGLGSDYREVYDISRGQLQNEKSPDTEVPDFTSSLNALQDECNPLLDKLHRILARGLKLKDENYFISNSRALRDPTVLSHTIFRTLYYPALPEGLEVGPETARCAAHTDYGTITLLFQDQIGGLEVKNENGRWIPADPIPGTILVNTGDLLNIWSGGRYPAGVHRVLIPESEAKKRLARQSITYFVHPDAGILVSPLNSKEACAEQAGPVSAYEQAQRKVKQSYMLHAL